MALLDCLARAIETGRDLTVECCSRSGRLLYPLIEPYIGEGCTLDSVTNSLSTPKGVMNLNLAIQMVTSFAFFVCSWYVSKTENAGFGVVITSIIYTGFSTVAAWVVNKRQDAIFIGLVLGAGIILTFFSLLTAIFWGELSQCEVVSERKISKYSCREELKAAMKFVSIFATFMFLLQMSFTFKLFYWRTNIMAEQHNYSEVPFGASESDHEPLYVISPANKASKINKADFETLV